MLLKTMPVVSSVTMKGWICVFIIVVALHETTGACEDPPGADLVFVLDTSYDTGSTNWQLMLDFVTMVINTLVIDPQADRVGLVIYSTRAFNVFYLETFADRPDSLVDAVLLTPFVSGSSNLAQALQEMKEAQYTIGRGDRLLAPDVALVITAGRSDDPAAAEVQAQLAQEADITMLAIGIQDADEEELQLIASPSPRQQKRFWLLSNFTQLPTLIDPVRETLDNIIGARCDSRDGSQTARTALTYSIIIVALILAVLIIVALLT